MINTEDKEHLIIHIEGLQATLSKRNARIEQLEKQVAELKANPLSGAAEKKAYKRGWKDCAGHLMETTRKAAIELSAVRRDAFRQYLDGDKLSEV